MPPCQRWTAPFSKIVLNQFLLSDHSHLTAFFVQAAAATNAAIDRQAMQDFKTDSQVIKLLLLGAGETRLYQPPSWSACCCCVGESGKSTLFKQMIQLYGQGFDKASLEGYKDNIHGNVIQGITMLAQQTDSLGISFAMHFASNRR
jgi:hypothetical protein